MAVVVASGATPRSFASGSFVLSTLQSGPSYQFTIVPSQVLSASVYNGYCCLLATNDNGGLYLVDRRVELYNGSGSGTLVGAGNALTASAGQSIAIRVNLAVGTNASSIVVSGATTGNGTSTFTASGTFFTASTLGVGQFTNSGTFTFAGTVSAVDDLVNDASGTAACGGITSTGTAIRTVFASGTATNGGITSSGAATSPFASGASACGGATSAGSAFATVFASGTTACGGLSSSGSAAGSYWGTQGASATAQSVNSSQPATGTVTTAFVARAPSTAYAQNARLTNSGRRYHVSQGGTTAAGAGPSTAGQVTDGTATLVAVNGDVATAPSSTTQPANSVLVAAFSRGQWATDTSAPTDNKGNTFTILESNQYATFAPSRSALAVKTNAVGGSGHVFSLTYANNDEVTGWFVEVPTGRSTSFIQERSFVERSGPTGGTVTSASVTTTGPAMLVAFCLGTGTVLAAGTAHIATVEAAYTPCPDADSLVSLTTNGYIQGKAATRYVDAAGTYTATWTTTEGAHLYLVAIQEIPWVSASGSASCGGITSAGTAVTTVFASGAAAAGGVSSAGSAFTTVVAGGSAAAGGITSTGTATTTVTGASGTAACGGVTSAGSAALVSQGSAAAGGMTSTGSAFTTVVAGGVAACGGITSAGSARAEVFAFGAAASGGVTSSGAAFVPGLASGASSAGGITSDGVAFTTIFAAGAAPCGGISSAGLATSSSTTAALPLPARIAISGLGIAPFRVDPDFE